MKHAEILLIDDNTEDILLITKILEQHYTYTFKVAQNFVEAAEYLFLGKFENPQLILLEITLSNHKGMDLLTSIKEHPRLKTIPLIVLTKSDDIGYVQNSYNQLANAFIKKPESKQSFTELIRLILEFWMETISLPEHTC